MKRKFVQVTMTDNQLDALHKAAHVARISASELIRRVLVKEGIIPDDELKHGGARERKPKVKK